MLTLATVIHYAKSILPILLSTFAVILTLHSVRRARHADLRQRSEKMLETYYSSDFRIADRFVRNHLQAFMAASGRNSINGFKAFEGTAGEKCPHCGSPPKRPLWPRW